MNRAQFLSQYPEFRFASDALIDAKLSLATMDLSPESWGALYVRGLGLRAAHLLAMTPEGKDLRLKSDSNNSPYNVQFQELQLLAGFGPVVV